MLGGHPKALEIEELRHPLANTFTLRDFLKVTESDFVLALYPILGRRSVVVLQPPVGIFDADPVVSVDDVGLRRGGIVEGSTHQGQGGDKGRGNQGSNAQRHGYLMVPKPGDCNSRITIQGDERVGLG